MKILGAVFTQEIKCPGESLQRRQPHTIPLTQVSWPEDYDAPCTKSNSELFPTKNKPLNHNVCGCNFSKVLNQKEEERTCNGNLCFGHWKSLFWRKRELALEIFVLASSHRVINKCNLSKARCIKNLDVNDETRFDCHKIWLLHTQPGKQGQECQVPPFTSLNGATGEDEKQDHEAKSGVPTSTSHKAAEHISKLHLLPL